jgi:ketosteroid isomerase-like protein
MSIRGTVDQIYRDYENRNIEGIFAAIPDDFCFEWPFDAKFARYTGVCNCKKDLFGKLEDLANNFEFNSYAATNIIVEDNKVAAQVELNLTSKKTGETFDATIAHFWTFEDEKPISLIEYMDTAMMKHQSS